jgi:hypothetical protein
VKISTGEGFAAEFSANPVATELAARLPLEATFTDFNGVEKVATLDRPLRVRGVPDEDSAGPGEIGYYAPANTLVFYYGSVGTWPGLIRIGRFELAPSVLGELPDGFTARLTRTDDDTRI